MKHIQKLRKLILALGILAGMSLTAYAAETTATWTDQTFYEHPTNGEYRDGFTTEGVTLTTEGNSNEDVRFSNYFYGRNYNSFSVSDGKKLTKIVIESGGSKCELNDFPGATATSHVLTAEEIREMDPDIPDFMINDMVGDYKTDTITWTGNAETVRFKAWINPVTKITFTIELPTVDVTGVTLDKTSAALTVGNTETLTATVSPDGATDKTVTWSTNDANVATVANGVVTAQGIGTATITVTATNGTDDTSDDKQATCTVTVTAEQPVTVAAKADPSTTGTYYATFYDSTTSYTADCEVYYATANADGRLTLQKAEGNVIKAGEGVILKATSETVTLTKTTTEASYDSLLTGSDRETTVENALVLSHGKNGVWFYKYSGTLGANKAYLAQ